MPIATGAPASPHLLRGTVLFASGPGFWVTRPAFWVLVCAALLSLVFVSRLAGWSALGALVLASRVSKARWREREQLRMRPMATDPMLPDAALAPVVNGLQREAA